MKIQSTSEVVVVVAMVASLSVVFVNGQSRPDPDPLRQSLTIFNRQGEIVAMSGEPGLYSQPAFSPDGTRIAVVKADPQTRNQKDRKSTRLNSSH